MPQFIEHFQVSLGKYHEQASETGMPKISEVTSNKILVAQILLRYHLPGLLFTEPFQPILYTYIHLCIPVHSKKCMLTLTHSGKDIKLGKATHSMGKDFLLRFSNTTGISRIAPIIKGTEKSFLLNIF